jgi:hypothetical protein
MDFIFHIIYTKFTISNENWFYNDHLVIIKQRLYDIAKQGFDEILHTSTKCNLYQYLVPTFYIQTYLTKPIESAESLQEAISAFEEYCNIWKLTVNTNKTKIVVFSKVVFATILIAKLCRMHF